ncbi:MAG: hypothetical protein ACRDPH_03250 [Marmoricola sp.]
MKPIHPPIGRAATALATAGVTAAALAAVPASANAVAVQSKTGPAHMVVAHMGKSIHLSVGHRVHAGRIMFRVVTRHGAHSMQIARLHNRYTVQQANADLNKAFGGDVAAVRRVDHNIGFLGGAETRPHKPGMFSTVIGRGNYLVLDQDGNAVTALHVFGHTIKRRAPHTSSSIGAFSYGFGVRHTIPHRGWTRVYDQSDQPHFVEFIRVKRSTTPKMVRKALSPSATSQPSFVLPGGTGTGVFSPGRGQFFHYALPRGKYLIACFWPDDDTGMPHAFMGMWKLIVLR